MTTAAVVLLSVLAFGLLSRVKAAPIVYAPSADVERLAVAIANAEGWYRAGTLGRVRNNPGNIKAGGVIATFPSEEVGWMALFRLLERIRTGVIPYYTLDMTVSQFAAVYVGTSDAPNWANNVAAALNVETSATLGGILL